MKSANIQLLTFPLFKNTLKVYSSCLVTSFLSLLGYIISVLYISKLNENAIAASGLIESSLATTYVVCFGLLNSVTLLSAKSFGEKNPFKSIEILINSLVYTIPVVLIPCFIIYYSDSIFLSLEQPKEVVSYAYQVLFISIIDFPLAILSFTFSQFLLAQNYQKITVNITIFKFSIQVFLCYFMIHGFADFKGFGLNGLVYTWILTDLIAVLFYITFCYFKFLKSTQILSYLSLIKLGTLLQLFKLGIPSAIESSSVILVYSFIIVIIGWSGVHELTMQQVINQYANIFTTPFSVLMSAGAILAGQGYGELDKSKISIHRKNLLLIGYIQFIFICAVLLSSSNFLVRSYIGSESILTEHEIWITKLMLSLIGIKLIFDIYLWTNMGCLRGMFDVKSPMYIQVLLAYFIQLPCCYILSYNFGYGVTGFVVANIIVTILGAFLMNIRFKQQFINICF